MERILAELEQHKQKATFFCLGWIAEKYPGVIRDIIAAGHEVGSHSLLHQLAYEQTRKEFRADLDRSIKVLQDITGQAVRYYRAPGFSITAENLWAFEEIVALGIELDCSVFPGNHGHGGMPGYSHARPSVIKYKGIEIKSLPINSVRIFGKSIIFSGGGYFRLFPLWMLRRCFANSDYVMTYFHPRDFDPDQPVIEELPLTRKFKSYVGLSGTMSKLNALMSEFEFVTVSVAEDMVDWGAVLRVKLG